MNKKKEEQILADWAGRGESYRTLALRYGISHAGIYRIVNKHKLANKPGLAAGREVLPDDVTALKAMLRKEQLKNELLNNIIDIADKELGTDIRKKSGTRQSK